MGANALGKVKSCALKGEVSCHRYRQLMPVHADSERKPDDSYAGSSPTFRSQ
jgi:hypothetical protein